MDQDDAFLDKAVEGAVLFALNQGEPPLNPNPNLNNQGEPPLTLTFATHLNLPLAQEYAMCSLCSTTARCPTT